MLHYFESLNRHLFNSGPSSTPNELLRAVESDERSIEVEDGAQAPNFEVPEHPPSPEELIQRGQYLVDCPSWLAFLGEDKRLQYSNHFISRNDKIWGDLLYFLQLFIHSLAIRF